MQTMELVDIEDVYPYEENDVRMNPRDVDDPACREYIAQLAEQFRRNRLNPGQPRVRPILYRDGGIYQIVDGECRYEAMKLIGTRRFYADVFDDLADAETARQEAAKAMVETDAKRALTAEELSRGVQTMLALDLPDEEVAAAARIDGERVRRARRASREVGDAAYDMTLDRLCAIAEFEGDEAAVAELRDCPARDWRGVYGRLRARRERARAVAGMVERARAAGVEVLDATPEGYMAARTFGQYQAAGIDAYLAGEHAGKAVATDYGLTFLEPAAGGEDDEEARRRAQEKADFYAAWEAAEAARDAWVGEHMDDITTMLRTARFLTKRALRTHVAERFQELTGYRVREALSDFPVAVGYVSLDTPNQYGAWNAADSGDASYVYEGAAADFVGLYDAMTADGYEPCEEEKRVARALRKMAREAEREEADGE